MSSRLVWCAPSCERLPGSKLRSKSVPKIAGSTCDQSSAAADLQDCHIGGGQVEDFIVGKQPAVEIVNVVRAEGAASGGHRGEELAELARKFGGLPWSSIICRKE